jgi:hypothetical protein
MSGVYLPVGPVKTGSTYLQALLWRNREDLAQQGYQHPGDHDNEMWLAANDVQDQAFIHFEMPEGAGLGQGLSAGARLRWSLGDLARGARHVDRGAYRRGC